MAKITIGDLVNRVQEIQAKYTHQFFSVNYDATRWQTISICAYDTNNINKLNKNRIDIAYLYLKNKEHEDLPIQDDIDNAYYLLGKILENGLVETMNVYSELVNDYALSNSIKREAE